MKALTILISTAGSSKAPPKSNTLYTFYLHGKIQVGRGSKRKTTGEDIHILSATAGMLNVFVCAQGLVGLCAKLDYVG